MQLKQILLVVTGYFLAASLWILFSDALLHNFIAGVWRHNEASEGYHGWIFNTIKGLIFVVVTAGILLLLLMRLRSRESERYNAFFENHHAVMLLVDPENGMIVDANPAAVRFYGYSREQLSSFESAELYSQPNRDLLEDFRRIQLGGSSLFHFAHRLASGEKRDVEVYGGPIELNGKIFIYEIIHDVTERIHEERRLHSSELKFRALTEQSIVGIIIVADLRITYANPRAAEIFGSTEPRVIGSDLRSWFTENVDFSVDARSECQIVRSDQSLSWVEIHITSTIIDGSSVLIGVMQDISDRLLSSETIRDYVRRLEKAVLGTVDAISQMVELRDPYTAGHERKVGMLAAAIAREMEFDEQFQRGMRIAGAVHDAGKIVVPTEILVKPGRLSAVEFELIKAHAEQGYEVLKGIEFPWPVAEVARQHHERINGSGYPRGLRGDEILIEARIIAIADVVQSMADHRPYRPALGIDMALAEIESGAGILYDREVSRACLSLFRERGYVLPQ